METADRAAQAAAPRQRRVGTLTLGIVLVAAGVGMLASMFWSGFRPEWLLKASPCILILLGAETLLSARGGGRVKYDWLGMILCFVLTGTALCMYGAAWWLANVEIGGYQSRWAGEEVYEMSYAYFNGMDSHTLRLEAGDTLWGQVDTCNGWLEVEISDDEGNTLCDGFPANRAEAIPIERTGNYIVLVCGHRAGGGFSFRRIPAEEPALEAVPAPESESAPEESELPAA